MRGVEGPDYVQRDQVAQSQPRQSRWQRFFSVPTRIGRALLNKIKSVGFWLENLRAPKTEAVLAKTVSTLKVPTTPKEKRTPALDVQAAQERLRLSKALTSYFHSLNVIEKNLLQDKSPETKTRAQRSFIALDRTLRPFLETNAQKLPPESLKTVAEKRNRLIKNFGVEGE